MVVLFAAAMRAGARVWERGSDVHDRTTLHTPSYRTCAIVSARVAIL